MDESDLLYSDMPSVISEFDVIVIHKPSFILWKVAKEARKQNKIVIYDTDDYDAELYSEYYLKYWLQNSGDHLKKIVALCDGVTVSSAPLARVMQQFGKPVAVVDNGYDTDLSEYQIENLPYFTGLDGEWLKIVFGGSTGHARDIELFLRLGVIEALSEHKIDWYFHGVFNGPPQTKHVGNSEVKFLPGEDISSYLQSFYFNADILIAPLVIDKFNDCRSTIKLIEAGLAGIPAVVSNVESYRGFSEGVTLVENTTEQWVDALQSLILSAEVRESHGNANKNAVYARHTAAHITQQRVDFYENFRV
jgi:glycosyltransferase involved in cell wall biosynthesis